VSFLLKNIDPTSLVQYLNSVELALNFILVQRRCIKQYIVYKYCI